MRTPRLFLLCAASLLFFGMTAVAQEGYDGLHMGLGNLYMLSNAETRSISAENYTGEKGKGGMAVPSDPLKLNVNNASKAARELGQGWKVNPMIRIEPGKTFTLAEIDGPGAIQHMWFTTSKVVWRWLILRIYWDNEETPSVECPLADFFCMGWNQYSQISSLAICVNTRGGFNSYWPMPFRKKARITIENIDPTNRATVYYQINYTLTKIPKDAAYFHAQYRHTRYNETSDFTVLDGVKGKGHYVGMYMALGVHNDGWWGEGEAKFFIDGDTKFPTICTTGLEDYFCGAYCFDINGKYVPFVTPYSGFLLYMPDGRKVTQERFSMYRWHIQDPIRFKKDLRITFQDLGWWGDGRYLPQHSEIATTAFWYQTEPHAPFPAFPSRDDLEVR